MEVLDVLKALNKAERAELIKYLTQLNEFDLIEAFIDRVDPNNIAETMYPAYFDLMIDSETGKSKPEFQK